MSDIEAVLIVDDDEMSQLLTKRLVQKTWNTKTFYQFCNPVEAIDFLNESESSFDIVFLDIDMPRLCGFEFLERVAEETPEIYSHMVVVMVTGSVDPDDRRMASTFDVIKHFVKKPLTGDELIRIREELFVD